MRYDSPLDSLAASIHHALLVGLPDEVHLRSDSEKNADYRAQYGCAPDAPFTKEIRYRPGPDSCTVYAMFEQTWGGGSLGFGGLSSAAMTSAYTVVLKGQRGHLLVYWAGRHGYTVDPDKTHTAQLNAFKDDLAKSRTASQSEAKHRYGAKLPLTKT